MEIGGCGQAFIFYFTLTELSTINTLISCVDVKVSFLVVICGLKSKKWSRLYQKTETYFYP